MAKHEEEFIEPKGDVIRAFLPKDRPCLILMDEVISYVSTYRKSGYHNCLYNFMQSLSETARGQDGDIETGISPNFLIRHWPPAFTEWSTKSVQDAFFSSPKFPRLLERNVVKETISRGVSSGIFAYVGKSNGSYTPFVFETSIGVDEIEVSNDMFIIKAEEARKHIEPPMLSRLAVRPDSPTVKPGERLTFQVQGFDQHERPMLTENVIWSAEGGDIDSTGNFKAGDEEGEFNIEATVGDIHAYTTVTVSKADVPPHESFSEDKVKKIRWSGEVPAQKWMNFYTKVLAKYATSGNLKLEVTFEAQQDDALSEHQLEETKAKLRELVLCQACYVA